jgi:hypothetical protein
VLTILLLFAIKPAFARAQVPEIEPQIVIATKDLTCGSQPWIVTLEVWNVGSAGGDAYKRAVLHGENCVNDKLQGPVKRQVGTFSGGPNGIVKLEYTPGYPITLQFMDGKTVNDESTGGILFIVKNPEAFDGFRQTKDCSAVINLPPGLQPGSDLWFSASYTGEDGKPIPAENLLSEGWILNGSAGSPVTRWDGNPLTVELQYTCPGGQAHVTSLTIPPFQAAEPPVQATAAGGQAANLPAIQPTAAEQVQAPPTQGKNTAANSSLMPIVAGAVVLGGAVLAGAAVTIGLVVAKTKAAGAAAAKIASSPARSAVPRPQPQMQPKPQPYQQAAAPQNQAVQSQRLPQAQQKELLQIRTEMTQAVNQYKARWQTLRRELVDLERHHKKNKIKRTMQLGVETTRRVIPNKAKILDPILNEAVQVPDPKNETDILLKEYKSIQTIKSEMQFLQDEVGRLLREIHKINGKLGR